MKDIKKQLISNPDTIIEILETFDFCKISFNRDRTEIRCARDCDGNATAIRIKIETLTAVDFARNINSDLIGFIMKERNVKFTDVLTAIKKVLNIDNFYNFNKKNEIFGGIYNRIKHKSPIKDNQIYDISILNDYENIPNIRFLKDNISIETQKVFNIRFDNESQRIIIPIYNIYGELVGVKGRANWNIKDDECKYLYLVPCSISQTLYGYHINYKYLVNAETIYIYEAEKSVMQCYTYGIFNCVALGNHNISDTQIKKILELNPQKIIFMFDEGLHLEEVIGNILKCMKISSMKDVAYGYWEHRKEKGKNSPSDYGKERLLEIMKKEVCLIER